MIILLRKLHYTLLQPICCMPSCHSSLHSIIALHLFYNSFNKMWYPYLSLSHSLINTTCPDTYDIFLHLDIEFLQTLSFHPRMLATHDSKYRNYANRTEGRTPASEFTVTMHSSLLPANFLKIEGMWYPCNWKPSWPVNVNNSTFSANHIRLLLFGLLLDSDILEAIERRVLLVSPFSLSENSASGTLPIL